jgi:hypothetical protein
LTTRLSKILFDFFCPAAPQFTMATLGVAASNRTSETPVRAPVKFELVINLKTVKAFPATLLATADEVICT